jgi:hypothetical protein
MTDSEAITKLKAAMLSVQTVGEMHALIIDYTYVEIMEVYNQLAPKQQARIVALCDRDTQEQITATHTISVFMPSYLIS